MAIGIIALVLVATLVLFFFGRLIRPVCTNTVPKSKVEGKSFGFGPKEY